MDRRALGAHKKRARRLNAWLVFIDETGVLLLPTIRRSLAVCGHTPVLTHRARHRDKVSIGGAVAVRGRSGGVRLLTALYPNQYVNGAKTAMFLQMILRSLRGPVIVVWDRGNMHRGDEVRSVLAQHRRLTIEFLPPYAPELNPAEYLWSHIKADRLANFTPKDLGEILQHLTPLIAEVQHDKNKLQSFLTSSPLFGRGGVHYLGEDQ